MTSSSRSIDLACVAQGRFHMFDLARALLGKGMNLRMLTNYPAFAAVRFGLPAECLVTCPWHGVLHRYLHRWNLVKRAEVLERALHRSFSRWASRRVARLQPAAVNVLSGVALELFEELDRADAKTVKVLVRGSAHIREQYQELMREGRRAAAPVELPALWMVKREMQEYRQADYIQTLSTYARGTFVRKGHAPERLHLLPLGSEVADFRPAEAALEERLKRVRTGAPLQVICTGAVSLRKGLVDMIVIARQLEGRVRMRWVGRVAADAEPLMAEARRWIEFVPHQPQGELVHAYNQADLFALATVEDGFAVVLEQARANGLPILATSHSAAPDLVEEGVTGWVMPPRKPELFVQRLLQCDDDRPGLAAMIRHLHQQPRVRDWSAVADDFLEFHRSIVR